VRHARQQPVTRDARIVDEHVQLAGLLNETSRVVRIGHVCLDGSPTDLVGDLAGLVLTRPVADDHLGARPCELDGYRPPDSPRRAGDEGALSLQRAEPGVRHADASVSSSLSRAARLSTGIAFTLRSMRLTKPES